MDRADEGGDRGSAGANNGWWLSNHGEQIAGMRGHAIFAMDSEGFITSWNDHAEKVNGFPGDEVIGRHCSVLYPADQAEQRRPEWQLDQAARAGFYMDQGWRRKKDDSRFWASIAITVQRSNDGSLDGFIAMIRDETEARARHQRSTRRFTDLFDSPPWNSAVRRVRPRAAREHRALRAAGVPAGGAPRRQRCAATAPQDQETPRRDSSPRRSVRRRRRTRRRPRSECWPVRTANRWCAPCTARCRWRTADSGSGRWCSRT